MSIEKIERDLREALSGLTLLEMASRGMIPVSRAMVEAHEAYTKLCADRDNIRALLDELSRLREERDNLWMAYLHAQKCFHGGVKSTNPDQRAHNDVDRAVAGRGPKDGAALAVAKRVGRLDVRVLSDREGQDG